MLHFAEEYEKQKMLSYLEFVLLLKRNGMIAVCFLCTVYESEGMTVYEKYIYTSTFMHILYKFPCNVIFINQIVCT